MRNLLDFLKKYHHWLLFIFLEVVSAVLLFQYNAYQGSVWLSSANVLTGKMYEWESDVTAHFRLAEAALPIAVQMEAEILARYLQFDE